MTPTPVKTPAITLQKTFPSRMQQESEAMVMRATDQWMAEYNEARNAK